MGARSFYGSGVLLAFLTTGVFAQSAIDATLTQPALGQTPIPRGRCVLLIEGQAIQSLTIVPEDGSERQIVLRRRRALLPAGQYRLQTLELAGGYYANLYEKPERFTLSPAKPYVLRAGAPLTAHVETARQGRLLVLNYRLRDMAGRSFNPQSVLPGGTRTPPQFTILRDGQPIHSGSFAYG